AGCRRAPDGRFDGGVMEDHAVIAVAGVGRAVGAHADVVAGHDRPVGVAGGAPEADEDAARIGIAGTAVGGDDVVADDRVLGRVDDDAVHPVADRAIAGDVGAEVVAPDHVVVAKGDVHAVEDVAGDDVAQVGSRAADGVAAAALDEDALSPVGAGFTGAGLVRADQVVLDEVAVGRGPQVDADPPVGGDQVAVSPVGAADGVARRVLDADARAV